MSEPGETSVDAPRARRPLHGLVVVAASLSVWWPAFTLGAWGVLFFDQNLMVWVASTAAFVVVAFQPRPFPHRTRRLIALSIPSLWLLLSFIPDAGEDWVMGLIDLLALVVALAGIPFTLWVLAAIFWPDLGQGLSRGAVAVGIGAIAGIAVLSFVLGANQALFLTCEDFALSGNSNPPGCVHAVPDGPAD
ncbi:hypothetical protein [Agromyces sp. Leaf222]|uniref:hypothetical protein n=1 Tax=Agromyces sp. Leaf222 TaxID=1735688 RepID=UPI0006F9379B|nr:hypothetical protein [Agromyces sp. Leaf222]KQM82908.1 hypothetical protein ASE68_06265 [Agromyces sp. Leaf222]